ncbi:MAG: glycoside hydrolase family 3 C-terminal domain-containing protein, partial [Bacteroidales bacterium]|nr:glycoside hydrolase family 3 C-terminal domain-containing protein [Bacteroidales bacterium]
QGDDTTCFKLIATAKHLAVHSGPEAIRHSFNAEVSNFDLYNSYLPHFKMTIDEADVQSVMCAYNRLLDEPCCGSNPLLADILRNKWGFKGYVVSDCWAISDFYQFHKITPDAISSASKALKAGTDLNCGSSYRSLQDAFKKDMISLDEIDTSLRRLFGARIKLGMFDNSEKNPFASLAMSRVDTLPHQRLALKMARESIVLLKNEASLLPLSKDISAIAVIGPNADAPESLLGNYHGSPGRLITPLQGIRDKLGPNTSIYFVPGIPFADSLPQFCLPPVDFEENPFLMGESWMEQAMEAVRLSDVVILCMGLSPSLEGEALQVKIPGFSGGDRVTLMLPAIQQELIKRVVQQAKPVVLLLMSGSAVSIPWEKEHIPAILQAWYPGQVGGTAIADVLFGDYNPGGKLPVTMYASDESLPDFTDYSMKNRTYRFINSEPLFEFGYGLSYTSFSLEDIKIDKTTLQEEESAVLSAKLTNTGLMAGDEVLQLYIDFPDDEYQEEGYINHPWLRGYQRIHLKPGESASVQFIINRKTLSRLNESGEYLLNGTYRIYLSNSSKINTPGIDLKLE